MKLVNLTIAIVLCGVCAQSTTHNTRKEPQRISVSELNEGLVLEGRLKLPLGTIVTVEGTVTDGASLKIKGLGNKTLLRMEKLDGKQISESSIFHFDYFQKEGKPLKAGSKFQFIGYETGRFVGVPHGAFDHIEPVAAEGYSFQTSFVVLKDVRSK